MLPHTDINFSGTRLIKNIKNIFFTYFFRFYTEQNVLEFSNNLPNKLYLNWTYYT